MRRQKGSITVFAVLSILLIMGFLLTLLEGCRMKEMHRVAALHTQVAVEAAFANYSIALWDTYHLLGCRQDEVNTLIWQCSPDKDDEYVFGTNLLLTELEEVEIESYTLMTDGAGDAYIQAVSSYMKNNVMYEAAKVIFNQYESIKHLLDSNRKDGTEIKNAIDSLESLDVTVQSKGTSSNTQEATNPLEKIQRMQNTQILELVVEDASILSDAQYDISQTVSHRELNVGWNYRIEEPDWLDRVLLQQYLLTYFADYSNPKTDRGLQYELEYVLVGADNDIENLRTVVNELLLIRETANFVYLMSDADKALQAEVLATLLVGASINPIVIELVKSALLLAWAFAESILDIRALLQGKKIPLIKSKDTWTLAFENIGNIEEEFWVAKESEAGLCYKNYLGIMLLLQENQCLAYRAMDVQEIVMQMKDSKIRMDNLTTHIQVTNTYDATPRFASLKELIGWDYKISATVAYEYN